MNLLTSSVDSVMVHLNDSVALLRIRSCSSVLHVLDSVVDRNDVSKLEECRLKNSVYSVAQTDLLTDLNTIDGVELDVSLPDLGGAYPALHAPTGSSEEMFRLA